MSNFPPDNDPWAGLEPPEQEEPRGRNTILIVGIVAAALCVLGVILIAAFVLLNGGGDNEQVTPIVIPTRPETPTAAAADVIPSPTTNIAPTVTLPNSNPTATTAIPTVSTTNVEASRLAIPPTIDGTLTEWPADWLTYRSSFRVYNANSWDGSDDVEAVWRLAWDNNNLYVAVEVTDNLHVQTQIGNQIFRGDSVDLQVDTDRAGDFGPGLNLDDFQINLSPGNFSDLSPSAFRFQGTADGKVLDAPGGHHVTVAAQKTGPGYTLEAAIPWSDLNLTPSVGLVLGLALNVNDNDQSGQAVQEVMKSNVSTRTLTNPSGWGTLTLQ